MNPLSYYNIYISYNINFNVFLFQVEEFEKSEFPPSMFTERKKEINSAKTKTVRELTISFGLVFTLLFRIVLFNYIYFTFTHNFVLMFSKFINFFKGYGHNSERFSILKICNHCFQLQNRLFDQSRPQTSKQNETMLAK